MAARQKISSGTEGLTKTGSSGFRPFLRVSPAGSVLVGKYVCRNRRWGGIGNPAKDFVLLESWGRGCGGIGNPARGLDLIVAWWCYPFVPLSKTVVFDISVVITSWLEVAGAPMAGQG